MNLKVGDILICHKMRLKERKYILGQIIRINWFEESDDYPVKAQACRAGTDQHSVQYSYDYLAKHYRLANSLELLHFSDAIEKLKEVSNG